MTCWWTQSWFKPDRTFYSLGKQPAEAYSISCVRDLWSKFSSLIRSSSCHQPSAISQPCPMVGDSPASDWPALSDCGTHVRLCQMLGRLDFVVPGCRPFPRNSLTTSLSPLPSLVKWGQFPSSGWCLSCSKVITLSVGLPRNKKQVESCLLPVISPEWMFPTKFLLSQPESRPSAHHPLLLSARWIPSFPQSQSSHLTLDNFTRNKVSQTELAVLKENVQLRAT